MPATRPVGPLREQAAKVILQKLEDLTISEAARALGVSRQAIYGFKTGDYCPSLAVIQRACNVWGLEFQIQGVTRMTVDKRSFRQPSSSPTKESVQQITMFDLWEQLEHRKMTVVRATKVDGGVEMTLRISIPA